MSDGFYLDLRALLHFNVRFLISFASLRIFDVIFEVVTDLVQSNPSLDKKTPVLFRDPYFVIVFYSYVIQSFGANASNSLTECNFSTGTAVSGGRLDFRSLAVPL